MMTKEIRARMCGMSAAALAKKMGVSRQKLHYMMRKDDWKESELEQAYKALAVDSQKKGGSEY